MIGILALLLVAQEPESRTDSGLRVQVDSTWARPRHPFPYPIRIRVENLGPARDIECFVEDTLQANHSRKFHLAEGEKTQFTLLISFVYNHYGSIEFRIGGEPLPGLRFGMRSGAVPQERLYVDVSGTVAKGEFVVLTPERLPDEWQAYLGLKDLWISAAAWDQLSESQRRAVRRSVMAGQRLVFFGTGSRTAEEIGFTLLGVPWTLQQRVPIPCGWGSAVWFVDRPEKVYPPQKPSADFFESNVDIRGAEQVPSGVFLAIVLCFALLIGPVNFLVVRAWGRRMLFLATTPALAIVASLSLFGYSALRDGFGIRASVRSITYLPPDGNEAVVFSVSALYSGLGTGTWTYAPDTIVFRRYESHEDYDYRRYRGRGSPSSERLEIDWSQGQRISGGWVPARTLTKIGMVQVVPHRARLAVEESGEGLRVHNGLGCRIEEGVLRRGESWYRIPRVEEGQSVVAVSIPAEQAHDLASEARMPSIPDGGFVVKCDSNPLLDRGGKRYAETDESAHLIVGTSVRR